MNKHNKLKNIPKINVISVCRFVKQKNIKYIINISKVIPEVYFQIIGYGKLWKDIDKRIMDFEIKNVKLIGIKKVFLSTCIILMFICLHLYKKG